MAVREETGREVESTSGSATMTWSATRSAREGARAELLDEVGFRRLHDRVAGPLVGYLTRLSGHATTAQDLAQETWLKLLSTPVDSSNPERLRSFVFCIATNLARDLFRRRHRETLFGLRPRDGVESSTPPVQARAAAAHDIDRSLEVLTPRERILVLLAHVEGFDHREIAEILGIKRTSVRVLLFRARKRLARHLERRGLAPEVTP